MSKPLNVGETINRFEILSVLRQSDVTTVYLVKEVGGTEKLILKEINQVFNTEEDLQAFRTNFLNVCKQTASLNQKSLYHLDYYFADNEGRFFMVQKYLEGRYLNEFLEDGFRPYLDESQVKAWAIQICDVLEYLHSQNPPIYMGIILPSHLSVSPMGTVRIMDLGLARFFPKELQREIFMKSSPGYLAPEIFENDQACNVQSDIYSLGVLFHYFLSGVNPNENPFHPPDLAQLRPELSENTIKVIMRAINPDPERRFKSVREMRDALVPEKKDRQRTKLECTIASISYENIPPGTLLQGEFKVSNTGKGCLEGVILTEYNWLKALPDKFYSNQESIRYLIDTTYMQPERVHENTITIQTAFEKIVIPVRITVSPGYLRSLKASTASFLMLLLPIIYFGLLELLRLSVIKTALDDIIGKGTRLITVSQEYLTHKIAMEPGIVLANKLYAAFVILMPYLVPMLVGKMQEKFRPQVQKKTMLMSIVAMILPTILLLASLYLNLIPLEIAANPMMKYLDPQKYIDLFIPANLLVILMMASPKDFTGQNFIDRSLLVKIIFTILIAAYFITAVYLQVLL